MSLVRQASKGLFSAIDVVLPSPPGPRLLIYHQVGVFEGKQMEVTVEDFESQLDILEAEYRVVTLDEALAAWNESDSRRLAVITFDDGYKDTFTVAHRRLASRGLPYTIYLASQMVEEPGDSSPTIDWDDLEAMVSSGLVTIGAHTHSHPDLRDLSTARVEDEIDASDRLFDSRLGIKPEHFAYPWGYWSESADAPIRARYATATLGGGWRVSPTFDPHLLRRFPVQLSDGVRWFRRRLDGGMLAEEWVRRRLRGYHGP